MYPLHFNSEESYAATNATSISSSSLDVVDNALDPMMTQYSPFYAHDDGFSPDGALAAFEHSTPDIATDKVEAQAHDFDQRHSFPEQQTQFMASPEYEQPVFSTRSANTVVPSSTENATPTSVTNPTPAATGNVQASSVASSAGEDNTAALEYRSEWATEAEVDVYVKGQSTGFKTLNVNDDDIANVTIKEKHDWCSKAYAALTHKPCDQPTESRGAKWQEPDLKVYAQTQKIALQLCQGRMNTPESRKRAMAYCDKLFWIAKRAHEIGLPNNLLKPKARSITTLSGHPVEVKLKFTERLQKVKDIIGSNKHIALDVLRGERLDDIVWAPISSVKRKESNTKGNGRKSVALVKAKDKKQGLVGGIKVTDATNATDGADAEDGDVEAVEEEESSEDTVVKSSAKRKRTA